MEQGWRGSGYLYIHLWFEFSWGLYQPITIVCVDCGEVVSFKEFKIDTWAVFRIRIILMRIRIQIRGSASGMMDPDPGPVLDPEQIPIFFFLIFSVWGLKLIMIFFCCNFKLIIRVY